MTCTVFFCRQITFFVSKIRSPSSDKKDYMHLGSVSNLCSWEPNIILYAYAETALKIRFNNLIFGIN